MIAKSAGQMVASPGLRDKWLNSGTIPGNLGWLASLLYISGTKFNKMHRTPSNPAI